MTSYLTKDVSRAARGLLEWSQRDLAAAAHVSESTVRDFEKGRRTPSHNNMLALERALAEGGVRIVPADGHGGVGIRFADPLKGAMPDGDPHSYTDQTYPGVHPVRHHGDQAPSAPRNRRATDPKPAYNRRASDRDALSSAPQMPATESVIDAASAPKASPISEQRQETAPASPGESHSAAPKTSGIGGTASRRDKATPQPELPMAHPEPSDRPKKRGIADMLVDLGPKGK